MCVCVCVCVRVCACAPHSLMCACVRACMHACLHACMHACVHVCKHVKHITKIHPLFSHSNKGTKQNQPGKIYICALQGLSSTIDLFPGKVIPVTLKLVLQWLPSQVPGISGSVLGLVSLGSVYWDWVR